MSAKQSKKQKLTSNVDDLSDNETSDAATLIANSCPINIPHFESVLSIQIIFDKITSYLTYKDVHRLSLCCRALRELSAIEFQRRSNGWASKYLLYRLKNTASEPFLRHSAGGASAALYLGSETAQQKLCEEMDQLTFRPKIAFLSFGNVKSTERQMWSKWFRQRLPRDCTALNVLSKTAICGSIDTHVYEAHKSGGNSGLAYLLFGTQRCKRCVHVFKSLKELVQLTEDADNASRNGPVKCILYLSRSNSRAQLCRILSVCKERNNNSSIVGN